jgi:hypothetical protein
MLGFAVHIWYRQHTNACSRVWWGRRDGKEVCGWHKHSLDGNMTDGFSCITPHLHEGQSAGGKRVLCQAQRGSLGASATFSGLVFARRFLISANEYCLRGQEFASTEEITAERRGHSQRYRKMVFRNASRCLAKVGRSMPLPLGSKLLCK